MDVSLLIRNRLKELGIGQKELAAAADVTESYISQLLARKKAPPAPGRTDIYEKIGKALCLPSGELAALADQQRKEELRRKVSDPPRPLFEECRVLVLRKCERTLEKEVRRIFEKEPFGELERLVTQKLLDIAQGIAKDELRSEEWLRLMAEQGGRSYEQTRVALLDFLDTDVFGISASDCVAFLDPMIDSWEIDLNTFSMQVVLNRQFAARSRKRFEFAELPPDEPVAIEPGLKEFLGDAALSGDVSPEEVAFLRALQLRGKRPSKIYYYRELQNLRDPLHFPPAQSRESH